MIPVACCRFPTVSDGFRRLKRLATLTRRIGFRPPAETGAGGMGGKIKSRARTRQLGTHDTRVPIWTCAECASGSMNDLLLSSVS